MHWPKPLELTLRLVLGLGLALCVAQRYGRELAEASLPLVGWAVAWMDDHYRLVALEIATQGSDTVFRLRVNLIRPLLVGNSISLPHPLALAQVTTTVGTFLQPSVILLGLLPVWPVNRWWEWLLRLLFAAPVLMVLLLLNTPLALWAYVWDIHVQEFDPDRFSPLLIWLHLLNGGGRTVIGLVGAGVIVWAASSLSKKQNVADHPLS